MGDSEMPKCTVEPSGDVWSVIQPSICDGICPHDDYFSDLYSPTKFPFPLSTPKPGFRKGSLCNLKPYRAVTSGQMECFGK